MQRKAILLQRGDLIGLMESTASHKEIIDLSEKLDTSIQLLAINRTEETARLLSQHYEHLGELQTAYQEFSTARQKFCSIYSARINFIV